MLKNFTPRIYQETILNTCVRKNCLVVLPTGMGKTIVSLLLAMHRIQQYPGSKVLMLAPTKPLAEQHLETFRKLSNVDSSRLAIFTGQVSPGARQEQWKTAQFIFGTPQGVENDLIGKRIGLADTSLLVFDEAHRAVGDYSYVWIAKQYCRDAKFPRILALTASPGSDIENITEVCRNLHIEEVEIRTEKDPDVLPYVRDVQITWEGVSFPQELKAIRTVLEQCLQAKLNDVKRYGYLSAGTSLSKTELLALQGKLHAGIAEGNKSFEILKSVSLVAEAMKVQHALELLETQTLDALQIYFNKLEAQAVATKVKAVKNLVNDVHFRTALIQTRKLLEAGKEHPKLEKLKSIVSEMCTRQGVKIIIFTQYRDTALKIAETLKDVAGCATSIFVGQAKKGLTGLTQKKQMELLRRFTANEFNILIATSVGEEGLDIPQVDLVLFYEPVPSAIRTIQRRGRTGRQADGRVIVLMTKETRDEAYKWSAHHKEKRMYKTLGSLKSQLRLAPQQDNRVASEETVICADHREKGSAVMKELFELGISLKLERLEKGDYLCSERVGVEIKNVEDFVSSIIDGRLLEQAKAMKQYERPLLIIEGEQDIYGVRKIHPNAIRGMLATIAIGFNIPIIYTKNSKETAALLAVIARREQEKGAADFSMHGSRKPFSIDERQEYIISSFPNIGPGLAKELLRQFKTIRNIVNAEKDVLKEVPNIGEKKAADIKKIVEEEYAG